MNISSLTSSISNVSSTYSTSPSSSVPTDDDDGSSQVQGHRGHGHHGGGMAKALTSALDSLGLNVPSGATAPPPAAGSSSAGSSDPSDDGDGDDSSAGTIRNDMKQFMQALGQAVQGESSSTGSSTSATGNDPKANFASGLSALISQVAGGNAPKSLQDAFTKLSSDLTASSATPGVASSSTSSSSSSSTSSSSTSSGSQATLQALLTQLQQNIGYSNSGSQAAVGNLLNTQV